MKRIAFLLIILISGCASLYQGTPLKDPVVVLEKVIETPDKDKGELYISVNSWFVSTFVSAESVIEYQDKEAGKVMGKYTTSFTDGSYIYNMRSTIAVDVKDNKAKIKLSEPMVKIIGNKYGYATSATDYAPVSTEELKVQTMIVWNRLVREFETKIQEKSEDW